MNRRLLILTGEKSGLDSILPAINLLGAKQQKDISIVAHNYSEVPEHLRSNIRIPSFSGLGLNLNILSEYLRTFGEILSFINTNSITDILFVDNPDFNLFLARILSQKRLNLFYFIIPQVWAWRRYRINYLKKYFRKIYVIFPFEQRLLNEYGIDAEYTGHPRYEQTLSLPDEKDIRKKLGLGLRQKIISLFPGTRQIVLDRHFRLFEDAAVLLAEKLESHKIIISDIRDQNTRKHSKIKYSSANAMHLLKISEFAVISSGSTTMEAAFLNVPFIGIYRPDILTYSAGKVFIKSDSTIMPNILLNERFIPEIISPYLIRDEIVSSVINIVTNRIQTDVIRRKLSVVKSMFEGYKTSEIMSSEIRKILARD